jgi:hypothetical protein
MHWTVFFSIWFTFERICFLEGTFICHVWTINSLFLFIVKWAVFQLCEFREQWASRCDCCLTPKRAILQIYHEENLLFRLWCCLVCIRPTRSVGFSIVLTHTETSFNRFRCHTTWIQYAGFRVNQNLVDYVSCWCNAFLLRLFPLFKYKTYIVSKPQLAT